ncbi:MAG TPA: toll/interleukin-1 receptor domain-containing protein, partial [Caulobacteraceae bacterium]
MAHDVFISYSSKDKTTADAICAVLERDGIRCWIAPRDVTPGHDWAESIIQAIHGSKAFILLFSGFSNASGQIKREVERAADREIPIIPFRLDDIAPNESLEFFISTPHWMDAFTPPLEGHVKQLSATLSQLIANSNAPSA